MSYVSLIIVRGVRLSFVDPYDSRGSMVCVTGRSSLHGNDKDSQEQLLIRCVALYGPVLSL